MPDNFKATSAQPRPPLKAVELSLNPPEPSELEMLEEILESLKVVDANLEKVITHLEELEAWAEKVDEAIAEIQFKSDYPGLDES